MSEQGDEYLVLAQGTIDGPYHWRLEVGGTDEAYWTGLHIDGPNGFTVGGGMAGPKLWPGHLMNDYSGRKGDGPLGLVIRADPSIVRVVLVSADGSVRDLAPCGDGVVDGLRFFIAFAQPVAGTEDRFGLLELRGLDADGNVCETSDLAFWDDMRPPRPQ